MQPIINYAICAVSAYLIGSLSFGIIISKLFYHKDIRNFGSKSAGMTNMLRTFGKAPAIATFICDVGKGIVAVALAKKLLCGDADPLVCGYVAAVFSILGHMFPIYFKFRGGKGVATALGVTTALAWQTFPIVMIPFVIIVAVSKMISLGSIISAVILPIATYFVYYFWYPECSPVVPTVATAVIALLIIFMHRSNIKRIAHGEENKLGSKKSDK